MFTFYTNSDQKTCLAECGTMCVYSSLVQSGFISDELLVQRILSLPITCLRVTDCISCVYTHLAYYSAAFFGSRSLVKCNMVGWLA